MAIYRGPGGAGDATVDATNAAAEVALKTQEAVDAATAAAASAAEAAASAVIASDGLDGIAAYAAAAFGSAADALASETNAADSEANAAISEANANEDAGTASTKANEASDSADAAALSASNAATSASNAATSASNAASSASSASNSATNAANSATSAAASAASTAGYLPSSTGNTGKYLRTNGTTNYWDVVDALPSQTGNSGKYLTTNGTSTSWAVVADPAAATPLVDGLVYGQTDSTNATWSGTITNNGSYLYYADYGNYNISFAASSAVGIAAAAGNVVVGQGITINDGTTTRDFGVITGVTVADPTYITTSLQPYGNPLIDNRYCATMVLTGTNGGNVGLGYNTFDSLNNGDNNTVIGHNAGGSIINGNNNIVIGYNADASSTSVSNEATIGNSDIAKTRLFGALAVGGSSTGTSGQVLTSGGSGSAPSWTTLSSGTVTSVALSAPTGLTVSGSPVTTSGTLALSYTAGYSIPTDTKQTNWDTAYGWGNHASAGYLTGITSGQVTTALGYTPENAANKNAANGYAGLDSSGLVPSSILPSYVDDVLEYANLASFPGTGATGKIYVALDTNKIYRWSGSTYIEISASPGSTDAVTEGSTNLYFTDARARSAISASGSISYNSSTGVISYTQPTNVSTFTNDSGYITSSALSPYLTSSTAASTYAPLTGTGTSGTWGISITGNAATVTNGLYSTGSYSNPTWLTSISGSIVSGNISGNAANVTGTVAVTNGGTGSTSLTANNVLLGNGTSALQVVAPGTNGNVLTSNGTTWVSSAPASSGISTGKSIAMAMIFGF